MPMFLLTNAEMATARRIGSPPPSHTCESDSLHTRERAAETADSMRRPLHHRVYVVRLENPRGDGRDGYYVGMTGLALDERFANHKRGYKSSGVVRKYGVELAWDLFDGIPAMSYKEAALAEPNLADDLRDLGHIVYGPTNRKPVRRQRVSRRGAPHVRK